MINKPNDIKNPFIVNFLFELKEIFGSDEIIQICNNLGYKVIFPSNSEKPHIDWKTIIHKVGFDENANDLLKRMLCLN